MMSVWLCEWLGAYKLKAQLNFGLQNDFPEPFQGSVLLYFNLYLCESQKEFEVDMWNVLALTEALCFP